MQHTHTHTHTYIYVYIYIYDGILLSSIKGLPFTGVWMDLETAIQSKVGHKEKRKSYINTYMWNLERWSR